MDKKVAQQRIEQTLNQAFDRERFGQFASELLNGLDTSRPKLTQGARIWAAYQEHISAYERLGVYTDPEGEKLDVLLVQVKSRAKLDKARTALRNFVIRHLEEANKLFALVAFYSKEDGGEDWRFSFVKLEYDTQRNKQGKVKDVVHYSPAKRYSFLVGQYEKAHTAKKQLLPLLQNTRNNPSMAELEAAFGIEQVTDEFFQQYQGLYTQLYKHLVEDTELKAKLEAAQIEPERFGKKLLGQIVFLYFLQKKGWLGLKAQQAWGEGDRAFVQSLYAQALAQDQNFFRDKLQRLFYEALAKERDAQDAYYEPFDCRIPFLNGGLFEPDYDWQQAQIAIPNRFFRNQDKTKQGEEGTGILDVFDRYNFTIKEDEPLDKEVAVDPEMLGKVFENMLDLQERKHKGAFYTPREIVHYMCQESLIHYLDNSLNTAGQAPVLPKTDIEAFIRQGRFALDNDQQTARAGQETATYSYFCPASIRQQADRIDQALCEIRICDPAIGSGAFPVGLLHELVTAMLVIKPHLSPAYLRQKLKNFGFVHLESVGESRYIYRLKRHIIQECIYGVDIDPAAIDVARLRLWLSLVVDEDDLDPIETLPNLDYKIVCGNSLIGIPKGGVLVDEDMKAYLESLKEKFYNETDEAEKKKQRNTINQKIQEFLKSSSQWAGYNIDFDFKLFFSEVWREKGGFDVVIGNPPYVGISKLPYKELLAKANYETYATSGDLYTLFFENGFNVLKPSGSLNFITSNKWINAAYGAKIRSFFAKRTNPLLLIDFAKIRIFSNATVFVNILMIDKKEPQGRVKAVAIQGETMPEESLQNYFEKNSVFLNVSSEEVWKIGSSRELLITKRIEALGTKLKDWAGIEFFRGITTGLNKAFHISNAEAEVLKLKNPKNTELIYSLLRGKDIKRWDCSNQSLSIIFTKQGVDIDSYPDIKSHLSFYYEELVPKKNVSDLKGRKPGGYQWYEIQDNTAYFSHFLKPKIVWIEISDRANYTYDEKGHFLTNSAYFISGENLKYLVAILNSSISDYYFFQITAKIAGGRKRYTKQYVEQIPIPVLDKLGQLPYEVLVDYILLARLSLSLTVFRFLETLLDALVFELYFPEEIRAAGKGILAHLSDLKPLSDTMTEAEKLALIQAEFERLYDPKHPVRFALETLDSVEEVRLIRAALQA